MDAVIRAAVVYVFLLVVFRVAGERTMASMTTFDFVLLLIIAEATQQGLVGDDFSLTKTMLVIITLVGIDIGISLLKDRSRVFHKFIEGVPLVLVEDGRVLADRMRWARVDVEDVLQAARERQGSRSVNRKKYLRRLLLAREALVLDPQAVPLDRGPTNRAAPEKTE